jgi:hypothetical protein
MSDKPMASPPQTITLTLRIADNMPGTSPDAAYLISRSAMPLPNPMRKIPARNVSAESSFELLGQSPWHAKRVALRMRMRPIWD